MQLHIFCDASLEARCIPNRKEVSFLLSKCRIAPIKQQSIPRLELQAALFSVSLTSSFYKNIILVLTVLQIGQIQLLCYNGCIQQIKKNVFGANRAADILQASSTDEGKHNRGELNPSYIGTRGTTNASLSESEWLSGPCWLKNEPEIWSISVPPISPFLEGHAQVPGIANNSMVREPPIDWSRYGRSRSGFE